MKAIILAAGSGRRIKIHKPKGMLNIGGKPLIEYSIANLKKVGVNEIIIVTGYRNDVYEDYFNDRTDVRLVHNWEHANCGSLHSLYTALTVIDDDDLVILDSDILYNYDEFADFMNGSATNSVLATNVPESRNDACYVETDINDYLVKVSKNINCVNIGEGQPWEYIGITKTGKRTIPLIIKYTEDKYATTGTIDHEYDYAFESIDAKYKVDRFVDYVWSEADDNSQLQYMVNIVYPKISL